ncbi:MAG: hypothetical protein K2Q34_01305 [Alphaproteobacteria bacterium]|nr:hypothetical protein [Alphaproteobacteria bacterium]
MKSLKILFAFFIGLSGAVASTDDGSFRGELVGGFTSINGSYKFETSTGETATYALKELDGHKVLIRNFVTLGNRSSALLGILCDLQNEKGYKIAAEPNSEVFFCDSVGEDSLLIQHGFRRLEGDALPLPLVDVGGENIYVRAQRISLDILPDGRKGNFKI